MAKFSTMREADAPRPLRQSGRLAARMKQYEDHVMSVKSGQVGKLVPDEGETVRGLALRIGRAARRVGKVAETWVTDGALFFKVR